MKWRRSLLVIGMLAVAMVIGVLCVSRMRTAGRFEVINQSGESAKELTVRVSDRLFVFHDLAPDQRAAGSFLIASDSHYDVFVQYSSGRTIKRSVGYVTNGLEADDALYVLNDRVEIRRRQR